MLPALSSRHRHAPFFLPAFPSRVSLLLGLGVEQGSKNPGTSTTASKPCSALHGDPLSPSPDPTREGRMDTPHESPAKSPSVFARCHRASRPRKSSPRGQTLEHQGFGSAFSVPLPATRHSGPLHPAVLPDTQVPQPATREVQLCGLCGRFGAALGRKPPTGSRRPERLPEPPSLSSDRRAGGVLHRTSPRSHLPPSGESPRAGPRERQCARAALPPTAGGGGDAAGGGAEQGARRCPRRPCSPPAAVPRGLSCVRDSRLGDRPRGSPEDQALGAHGGTLPGVLFAKTGEVPSSGGLRAAVTCLDPESAFGPREANTKWVDTSAHQSRSGSQDPGCYASSLLLF